MSAEQITRYFVDADGVYLGAFVGAAPPAGAIEIPEAPADARQIWGGSAWGAVPPSVPQEVSRAQAKIALLRADLLPSVEAAVAAAGGEVAIWFEDALNWRRDNPNVNSLGASLGLSSDGIDALFIQAAQIEA